MPNRRDMASRYSQCTVSTLLKLPQLLSSCVAACTGDELGSADPLERKHPGNNVTNQNAPLLTSPTHTQTHDSSRLSEMVTSVFFKPKNDFVIREWT